MNEDIDEDWDDRVASWEEVKVINTKNAPATPKGDEGEREKESVD